MIKFPVLRKYVLSILLFLTISSNSFSQCHYLIYMNDSYGDGWNGAYFEVSRNGNFINNYSCSGSFTVDSIFSFNEDIIELIFYSGAYDNEISFTLVDPMGDTIISGPAPENLDNLIITSNSNCESSNQCLNPTQLNASSITNESAILNWQTWGNENGWNLEWGVSGFNLGNGNLITNLEDPNYQLNNLQLNTTYNFYVQSICDSNITSEWSGSYSFTTSTTSLSGTCGTFTLGLYDSYGDGWNGASLDVIINGTQLQNITLANGNGPEIFTFSTDSNDIIDLIYNTGSWDNENTYGLSDNTNNTIVQQGQYGFIPNLDPVSTYGIIACPSCPSPLNLSANTTNPGTALLEWIGGNGTYNIEWGTTGFTLGNGNVINSISTNSYLLNGLNNGTSYDFYVQEFCSTNEISSWAGPFSFATAVVSGSCGLFSLELNDSFGDGWNGGFIDVVINGNLTSSGLTVEFNPQTGGFSEMFSISVDIGDVIDFAYTPGAYPEENSYKAFDQNGILIFEEGAGDVIPNNVNGVEACPSCPAPSNLFANTSTAGTALLDWTGGSSPFGGTFNIEWGPTGFNQGNGTIVNNINSNSYLVSGLASITTFDYYVQEVCNANDLSSWIGPLTFTTIYFSSGSECGIYNLKLINTTGANGNFSWGNSSAKVKINNNLYQTYTSNPTNGNSETFSFPLDSNDILDIVINFSSSGVWGSDLKYILYDPYNNIIASEQGTGSNDPPINTYGYQACATAPNSTSDFCDIYTLIMRKVYANNWQGSVEIEINDNVEYVGTFVSGGYRLKEPISFGVRGNDEVRVIANGLGFDEYYTVQNSLGDTIIDVTNVNSSTITVEPCISDLSGIVEKTETLSIYPNPSNNFFNVNAKNKIERICIHNNYSQLVYDKSNCSKNNEINSSKFSNGIYLITVYMKSSYMSKHKLVVNH